MNPKRISAKEFQEFGYLQEVNRKFFHPLGLALEVLVNQETGEVSFGGVWDLRDDVPEGISFTEDEIDCNKTYRVNNAWKKKEKIRVSKMGFMIQAIPKEQDDD